MCYKLMKHKSLRYYFNLVKYKLTQGTKLYLFLYLNPSNPEDKSVNASKIIGFTYHTRNSDGGGG